jgi:hypothetical protein
VATLTSGTVVYGRQRMVERYWAAGPPQESLHSSVSPRGTVSKWVRRYLAEGAHHLGEIRPHPSPTQVSAELEAKISLCAPKYGAGRWTPPPDSAWSPLPSDVSGPDPGSGPVDDRLDHLHPERRRPGIVWVGHRLRSEVADLERLWSACPKTSERTRRRW